MLAALSADLGQLSRRIVRFGLAAIQGTIRAPARGFLFFIGVLIA
jgi:hypothetical protein